MVQLKMLKAQNGDCFLISFNDNENNPRNILIDGGKEGAFYDSTTNSFGELKSEIDLIRNRNENIDLLVFSHIDNDHIRGLLKWFEMDKKANEMIKNIWFNSGKLIAEYLKAPENPELGVGLQIFQSPETGVSEAIEIEDYLLKKKIWNRKIVLKNQVLNDLGMRIEILSPDDDQLKKLLIEYKIKTKDEAYTARKIKDWNISLKDLIAEKSIGPNPFKQDTSVKNGSSVSFIITIADKKFLFLGDSHPKKIVESLRSLGFTGDKQLEVEAFKISHHGSKGNTNEELIKLIKTSNYLISTDSTGHNHPDKRTLARIVKNNPDAIFHFNYEFVKDNIMIAQDFKDFPKMKIQLTTKMDF